MKLPGAFGERNRNVHVIVETPQGSRNKYIYDPDADLFSLGKVLPAGTSFPMDFGFVPRTRGADGDPLDAFVMLEQHAYPGCLVSCRPIGVIEAQEKPKGKPAYRDDRLMMVSSASPCYARVRTIRDLDKRFLEEIIDFTQYYLAMDDVSFKLLGVRGPATAISTIRRAVVAE